MKRLKAASRILYVRGALAPFIYEIKDAGSFDLFLKKYFDFDELIAPYFYPNRPIWKRAPKQKTTNSGALGKQILKVSGSCLSNHPTHSFVGYGAAVSSVLARHDQKKACFFPLSELLDHQDFSMLLIGCVDSSPGFSTVHVNQFKLGLSQKHVLRYLMRWDYLHGAELRSGVPLEYPGCSASFSKFYESYRKTENFVEGDINGVPWIFIPSAMRAAAAEREILEKNPRFVRCDRRFCLTCSLRLY